MARLTVTAARQLGYRRLWTRPTVNGRWRGKAKCQVSRSSDTVKVLFFFGPGDRITRWWEGQIVSPSEDWGFPRQVKKNKTKQDDKELERDGVVKRGGKAGWRFVGLKKTEILELGGCQGKTDFLPRCLCSQVNSNITWDSWECFPEGSLVPSPFLHLAADHLDVKAWTQTITLDHKDRTHNQVMRKYLEEPGSLVISLKTFHSGFSSHERENNLLAWLKHHKGNKHFPFFWDRVSVYNPDDLELTL